MSRILVLAAATLLALAPRAARAQEQPSSGQQTYCTQEQLPNSHHTGVKLPSGQYNDFWGGGVLVRCPGKRIVLKADSAEIYGDERRIYLVAHVHYTEPRLDLVSDFLTYFMPQERILATGNVHATLPSGSKLDGPQAEYFRAVPKIRPRAQIRAIGRPTVTLVQRDSAGRVVPPTSVVSNTMFMDGDSLVYAGGQVRITREDYGANGDSAFIDTDRETMRLMRNPSVQGKRSDRPFSLVGNLIDMFSDNRKLKRVISRGAAVATSKDMTLRSDTIDLRVDQDLLQRADAWGAARARATSPTQDMIADSIAVLMPAQRVREVRSYRKAFAQGKPDTTKFRLDRTDRDTTDWMRGDTIVAHFDTLPRKAATDTAKSPEIRQIVSTGDASSLYHLAAQDTCIRKPAISYAKGHEIVVDFDSQQVSLVTVDGQPANGATGLYLEPQADSTNACEQAKKGTTKAATPATRTPTQRPGARPTPRPTTPSAPPRRPPLPQETPRS